MNKNGHVNKQTNSMPSRRELRGCNFIDLNRFDHLDMWQSCCYEEKLVTLERELALCQKKGFNTVRLWANFDSYSDGSELFMNILERCITLCDQYGQKVMMVLAYEEDLSRGDGFLPKKLDEQPYDSALHQNCLALKVGQKELPQKHYMEDPKFHARFLEMVRRILRTYVNDERVFFTMTPV